MILQSFQNTKSFLVEKMVAPLLDLGTVGKSNSESTKSITYTLKHFSGTDFITKSIGVTAELGGQGHELNGPWCPCPRHGHRLVDLKGWNWTV